MPETLATLFEQLRTVGPPAPFAPPSEVRRRGRRRTYRGRLAAGGAALAVGAIGVTPALVGGGPSPEPTPTPSLSPSPVRPPGGVLLEPSDLGKGEWGKFNAEVMSNPDTWGNGDLCVYDSADYPSLPHQESVLTVAWWSPTRTVTEVVERYAAGWGARNMDDVRAVVASCSQDFPGGGAVRFTVEDSGFTGDESLLVRIDTTPPEGQADATCFAVVRVGDLVATIHANTADADYVRAVAARAVARL